MEFKQHLLEFAALTSFFSESPRFLLTAEDTENLCRIRCFES